jgi:arylsulfatase A-like enzyme
VEALPAGTRSMNESNSGISGTLPGGPPSLGARPARTAPAIALGIALSLAFLDAAVDLRVRSSSAPSPVRTATVLAATSVAVLAAFGALWALLWLPRRAKQLREPPLALAVATFLGVLSLPLYLTCYRGVDPDAKGVALAAPIAAGLAAAVYGIARLLDRSAGFPERARASAFAVASCCALFTGWLALRQRLLGAGTLQDLAGAVLLLASCAALALLAWNHAARIPATTVLSLGFAAVVAVGAAGLRSARNADESSGRASASRAIHHVILVVVDTLRADHLTCYSKTAPPTPHFDAFAGDCVQFAHARSSAPYTFPSITSILTGLAPTVHLALHPTEALPRGVPTLAARMRDAGYLTAAFVRNPCLRPACNIGRGFEEYHFQIEPHPPTAIGELVLRRVLPEVYEPQVGADVQTARVSRWLAEHRDRDFFLWVHYFDPHMGYSPPREFQPEGEPPPRVGRSFVDASTVRQGYFVPDLAERAQIAGLYGGEVRFLDHHIAGLFDELKRQGLYENSLIVLTADHGEEFWEHHGFEHGHTMYDEVLSVPLLVKLPGLQPRGRVEVPVSNQSVTPTILTLAQVPFEPGELSAPSLFASVPAGDGGGGAARAKLDVQPRPLVSSAILYFENRSAVVFDGFKLIQFHLSDRVELYDLAADPGEKHSLADARPDLVERGRKLLAEHLAAAQALRERHKILPPEQGELDEATERDLRALGYVK